MQITDDIQLVEGARGANVYLISSDDGAILSTAACREAERDFFAT